MLKRFQKKTGPVKPEEPEAQVAENKDTDAENTDAGNEEINEAEPETPEDDAAPTEVAPEMDDSTETDEDSDVEEITEVDELNEEIIALQKELTESQNKYLRLAAEFDNYRKRTLREKTELIQTAGESLLIEILPVVDDFERGLEQASQAEDMDAVIEGMELIYNKLKEFLSNRGVKDIQAIDEPFDTDWHEAVCNIPAPTDDMKGKIVDVIQKGYTLHDKVIRYPKVVVGE